jgi:hypothetical protein
VGAASVGAGAPGAQWPPVEANLSPTHLGAGTQGARGPQFREQARLRLRLLAVLANAAVVEDRVARPASMPSK